MVLPDEVDALSAWTPADAVAKDGTYGEVDSWMVKLRGGRGLGGVAAMTAVSAGAEEEEDAVIEASPL